MRQALAISISLLFISMTGNLLYGQSEETDSFYDADTLEYEVYPFQMTFMFPPFSTNGINNVNYVNNLSLNMFIGVSGGVDGLELGGFINVDRFFMKGFQGAGFGNTVGGFVDGFQGAGFYNVVGGNVRYVQGAGFINVTGGSQLGLQGAGFGNIVGGDLFGFQGAGFSNVVGNKMTGLQGAGFINVAGDTVTGGQAAGFLNLAGKFNRGLQGAGFGNIAGDGKVNVQAAGFFNVADKVDGVQAAGFFNKAGYVKGLQAAGFLNVCDSIDGVPIAFISIVKHNGYRKFEISSSETEYIGLAYKMGVSKLYTIYSIGKPFGPSSRWMYGAGLGTQFSLTEKSLLNIELTYHQELWIGDSRSPYFLYQRQLNSYVQLNPTFGMSLGGIADFYIGPTLNISVAGNVDPIYDNYIPWNPIAPKFAFFNRTYHANKDVNVAIWVGLKGGLRF